MGMILGALAGAGQAIDTIAQEKQREWTAEQLLKSQQEAEAMKEARIHEFHQQDMATQHNYNVDADNRKNQQAIEAEKRALSNHKELQQSDLQFNTNPDNVKSVANAETTKLGMLSDFKYRTADQEAAYQRKLALAQHIEAPDHTDYAGLALDRQIKQLQLEEYKSGQHLSEGAKSELKVLKDQADDKAKYLDRLQIQSAGLDGPEKAASIYAINNVQKEINSLYERQFSILGQKPPTAKDSAATDNDPFELKKKTDQAQPEVKQLTGLLGVTKKQPDPVVKATPVKDAALSEKDPGKLFDIIVPYLEPADIERIREAPKDKKASEIERVRDRLIMLNRITK